PLSRSPPTSTPLPYTPLFRSLLQMALAQTDRLRGDLDQLIIFNKLDRVFKGESNRRHKVDMLVLARGADVGQLLLANRVHHQIVDRKSTRLNSSHVKISYAVF